MIGVHEENELDRPVYTILDLINSIQSTEFNSLAYGRQTLIYRGPSPLTTTTK